MAFAYCPDCAARIYLDGKPWLGQPVFCHYCDADLEVVHLNPLELDWAENVADDEWENAADVDWQEDWDLEPQEA